MSSLALIRLINAKNGVNTLIGRQLYYSTICLKTNSQKLLINNSNNLSFNNKINGTEQSNQLTSLLVRRVGSNVEHNFHNHSKIWSIERYLSIGLLAVIPASFLIPSPAMNYLLSLSLVTHVHWGIEAIVVDYIRPTIFGKVIPKLAMGFIHLLSILSVGGLFYFNYTDVGLVQAIRMIANM